MLLAVTRGQLLKLLALVHPKVPRNVLRQSMGKIKDFDRDAVDIDTIEDSLGELRQASPLDEFYRENPRADGHSVEGVPARSNSRARTLRQARSRKKVEAKSGLRMGHSILRKRANNDQRADADGLMTA